jgi:hypothetical protein
MFISNMIFSTYLTSFLLLSLVQNTLAAFGVTEGANYLDVDTGNKLVYRGMMPLATTRVLHGNRTTYLSSINEERRHNVDQIQ